MVVTRKRGKNSGVGNVEQVGMVLAGEGFTERWGHEDSRREVGVLKKRETVTDK